MTKHAALAFAEWLSVTYGDEGVGVSVLAPMGVNTKILWGEDPDSLSAEELAAQRAVSEAGNVLEPAEDRKSVV